jgi:hypothetical protein
MRRASFAFAAIFAASFSYSAHAALSCPANATQASTAVWPDGKLPTGQTFTRMHPCGRQITCTGGSIADGTKRKCSWQ